MGRIMAVDFGPKRVGLAVTDPLNIIASPLTTLPPKEVFAFISHFMESNEITVIVVGLPKKLDGSMSQNAEGAQKFAEKLQIAFPSCKIEFEDERFTSVIAHRAIIDGGIKKKGRRDKSLVDKTSASLILQTYLERKENR